MRFLIDNNLSSKLVNQLKLDFPGTEHVKTTVGGLADDLTIWNMAKNNGFTILTKDNDFDEYSQLRGCPPKIVHLICGNAKSRVILEIILGNKKEIFFFRRVRF